MNLQVDLILPSERRSSSPLGLQLIGKVSLLIAACAIGGFVGLKVMAITDMRSKLRGSKAVWMNVSPRKELAVQLIKESTEHANILEEIEAWKTSRPSWNEHLRAISLSVPKHIQLESISVQHEFQAPKDASTVRVFSLAINGRCSRKYAESAVQAFQQNIKQIPPVSESVQSVEVPRFGEDPKQKEDRMFQISCTYKPLKML